MDCYHRMCELNTHIVDNSTFTECTEGGGAGGGGGIRRGGETNDVSFIVTVVPNIIFCENI